MLISDSVQMRLADSFAINELRIPSATLMEKASSAIVEEALRLCRCADKVAVFAGSGNNGGDGIGAAYMMTDMGLNVRVFLVGSRSKMTADSLEMEKRLIASGVRLEEFDPKSKDICDYTMNCDIIIDAIFGIGLSRNVSGKYESAINLINRSSAKVLSADIASGVSADTGLELGSAVRADCTVTFSATKPCHLLEPGKSLSGKLKVADIGIPENVLKNFLTEALPVTAENVFLPKRDPLSHKGDHGKCLIIAGSTGFTGAPFLAAKGAVRSGMGLVYLGVPASVYPILAVKCTEEIVFPLPDDGSGKLSYDALPVILSRLEGCDVCVFGPGLGRSDDISRLLSKLMENCRVPLILDADGINALSGNINILQSAKCPVILTPHEGEFARLSDRIARSGRIRAASSFAAEHNCYTVLKGHRTVTALPDGRCFINTTGNPGMAKGGSGDVLTGIIASMLCCLPIEQAIFTGVFLHGLAGDMARDDLGEYSMTPTDLIEYLSKSTMKIMR